MRKLLSVWIVLAAIVGASAAGFGGAGGAGDTAIHTAAAGGLYNYPSTCQTIASTKNTSMA